MDTDTTPQAAAAPAAEVPALEDQAAQAAPAAPAPESTTPVVRRGLTDPTPTSKSQQKKLKRQQKWEEGRDERKRMRKEKRHSVRVKKAEAKARALEEGAEPAPPKQHTLVPVSLIFDCDFEHLMTGKELISMSSQLTRSYSANRAAAYMVRIYVSSWGGAMRERYDTVLAGQHKHWQNTFFLEDDFQEAGRQASAAMRGDKGGAMIPVLEQALEVKGIREAEEQTQTDTEMQTDAEAVAEAPAPAPKTYSQEDIVYLTSDSPHTLTHLEPHTSYVIGGIVDKNREKGLCFGRAEARNIRTAKLPIGEYMVMASRQVLTTNQVVEIMLKWLETGDWATAFQTVIPKRKGGQLKGDEAKGKGKEGEAEAEEGKDEEDENEDEDENDDDNEAEAEEAEEVDTETKA